MGAARPHNSPTDAHLAERVRDGDRRAFEVLYHRHAARVARLVYRLLGTDADLDEILQDVFVAAYEGIGRLRRPDRFGSWLSSVAVHHVRQHIARRQRWRAVVQRLVPPPPSTPAEEGDAERALSALPATLRMPFVLHRLEGYTVAETAELCGISEATTKRRCAEAGKRLARRFR